MALLDAAHCWSSLHPALADVAPVLLPSGLGLDGGSILTSHPLFTRLSMYVYEYLVVCV